MAQAEPRKCFNCDGEIPVGERFFRYMVAEHRNSGTQSYSSRRRVVDARVCGYCHYAAMEGMNRRSPRRRAS